MNITVGDRLPSATLRTFGAEGPEEVDLAQRFAGRTVVLFAVPGAFTPTCSSAHMPSFVRNAAAFAQKGVDEIVCVSVNDVHVMRRWGEATGADEAGILMLSDGDAAFTKALGLAYDNPAAGMFDRSRRYAMILDDGVVRLLNVEEGPGVCELSAGETLLAAL